jgi:hypothetical protein
MILLTHRGAWAEAIRAILYANVTMTEAERKALECALTTEINTKSGLLFGSSGGILLASIVYFTTNCAKRDSVILKRILGRYADFEKTAPMDFKAFFAFWAIFSSCILDFLWASIMIDQGMLTSWIDVGLFAAFTFILSEWINWNIVFDQKKPHFADRDVELKFLDLRHRVILQTVHDLIYIAVFSGVGLYISVIIPGALHPSIIQLSPLYSMAMTASMVYSLYLGTGFMCFLMQFLLELGRIERYVREMDKTISTKNSS